MDWKTWTCQRQAAIEEERDQTLREWNSRIDRLTTESNMGGPKTSPSHSKEGEGYAGFYHHLVANDSRGRPATSPSFKTQQRNPPKRDTNFERWISRKIPQTRRSQNSEWEDFKQDEAITLAIKKEIQRAFEQADENQDGWLNCEEFKTFMELRNSPITHVDAKRLLKVIDPVDERFISYDQVMFLVTHCGITTEHEVPITSDEFNRILHRMRLRSLEMEKKRMEQPDKAMAGQKSQLKAQSDGKECQYQFNQENQPHPLGTDPGSCPSGVMRGRIPMDKSVSFFEEMASDIEIKAQEERLYQEYRREIQRRYEEVQSDEEVSNNEFRGPPGWKNNIFQRQRPNSHVPPPIFNDVRKKWEGRSQSDQQKSGKLSKFEGWRQARNDSHVPTKPPTPNGFPASAFSVPGRPKPFVVTQNELQSQLTKILWKRETSEDYDDGGMKTNLLYKASDKLKSLDSLEEMPTT